jgi:hypothetical protein
MGRTFQFDCPQCQYRARVSGGADDGIHCAVQTMVCLDCRELFDGCTQVRKLLAPSPARFENRMAWLAAERTVPPVVLRDSTAAQLKYPPKPSTPARPMTWEKRKPTCPISSGHRVEAWNDPGRCPRCGCYLEKNGFPFRRWE